MTATEIRSAIKFGKEAIEGYKAEGREVPAWVYERQLELYDQLVEMLLEDQA